MHKFASVAILPAALVVLAACTAGAAGGGSTQAAADTPIPRALEGKVVGKPISCIGNRDILDTDAVTDRVILFRLRGGRTYRNDLPQSCPRVSRPGTAIVHRSTIDRLCNVDTIDVVDPVSGINYGACQLGKFQPYELPEGAAR
jgi:hypothetical protein